MTSEQFKNLKIGDLLRGTSKTFAYDASWLQIGMFMGFHKELRDQYCIFPIRSTCPNFSKDSDGCHRFQSFGFFEVLR